MAKLFVIDESRQARIPFLRGMLTRSLQDAGLEFADAYALATEIRDGLGARQEVTNTELRARTIDALGENHPKLVRRYKRGDAREDVQVRYNDGHSAPFSRGMHAQRLACCALPAEKCNAIASKIHRQLLRDKRHNITTDTLTSLTFAVMRDELDAQVAEQYLIWNDFVDSERPLVVLLGGVAGTGKSTVATDLANGLGIVRTQSTDMLREVMRVLIPDRVSPQLHTSSFDNAKTAVPVYADNADLNLLYGFRRQSELVEVACQAVLQRAVNERVSLVLEGVHIRPSLMSRLPESDAVVVPVMLCVLDKRILISHIKGRRIHSGKRRAARYLEKIEEIWKLQSALLSEADSADMQILNNLAR